MLQMLLRSSSTPLFQSQSQDLLHTTKLSSINGVHHCNLTSFSPNSSPISHRSPLRRSHSDGNLQYINSNTFSRSITKRSNSMLRTEPSFCIYSDQNDGVEEEQVIEGLQLQSVEFSFGGEKSMGSIEERSDEDEEVRIDQQQPGSPMYLATGFGIDGNGVGGAGGGFTMVWGGDDGGDVEEYYKRMISEDPLNSLFLGNYAQLLQKKGDLHGAEDYYLRATLLDPNDGEILMQYAKLIWDLHRDQDKAMSYFESATRASPQDSNVLAAYASFLWEVDEDTDDNFAHTDEKQVKHDDSPVKHRNSDLLAPREGENIEEFYKRMIDEDPSNPLFLKNYAQFLFQSKGDFERAEEYYSRAILADPADGDLISQYAKLVWKVHRDQDKASSYFEQAVRATPADCNVLAAYAGFLWETGEDEEDEEFSRVQDDGRIKVPVFLGHNITPTHA